MILYQKGTSYLASIDSRKFSGLNNYPSKGIQHHRSIVVLQIFAVIKGVIAIENQRS